MIREEERSVSQEEPHSYYVFADKLDYDDNGDEQASIYSTSVDSDELLTRDEVIEKAEEFGDWKIQYGEARPPSHQ